MACVTTHRTSTKVQGAGLCCSAVANGSLVKPPGTTTLPQYTPGAALQFPHVLVQTVNGHCGNCLIVGSKAKAHPGKPVLKFIPGGPGCPGGSGCCALTA